VNKKVWIVLISIAVVALLGAAAYQAMWFIGQGQPVQGNPSASEVAAASTSVFPTLMPTAQEAAIKPEPTSGSTPAAGPAAGQPEPTATIAAIATIEQPTRAPIIMKGWNGRPDIILSTQQPVREPDVSDVQVVEIKDQSIIVGPITLKGPVDQSLPDTEVVAVNTTIIYRDETNWDQLTPDGMVQRVVTPYSLEKIKPGDILYVWGYKRGERLVADVIIDYVCHPGMGEGC
jgi:hypothetical protein